MQGIQLHIAKAMQGAQMKVIRLEADSKTKVLVANKRRAFLRFRALNSPTVRIWFGPTNPTNSSEFTTAWLMDGDIDDNRVFMQYGPGTWQGEVWMEAETVASMEVGEYNESQFATL